MADSLKQTGKGAVAALQTARKRWLKAQEARRALAVLTRQNGPLPQATIQRAHQDAVDRFGAARHAAWLMVYAAAQGEYRDGWLPDSYYIETVMPRINGTAHHLGRVRTTNPIFFDSGSVHDLLYILNGRLLGPDHKALTPDQAVDILRSSGSDVVFKADHSGFGQGVRTIATADLGPQDLSGLGNGVVQPKITGHPVFDRFGSTALATLRIGTVLPDTGAPEVRTCYLKLGRSGHSHVIARDQIRIAVDWTSGDLDGFGYHSDWRRVTQIPGSDAGFDGVSVPAIGKAVATVVDLHAQMPLARYICWDLAIDAQEQIQLLEWEGGVVSFAEAVQGPCFAGLGWDRFR